MSELLTPLTPEYTLIIPEDVRVLIGWAIGLIGILILSIWLQDRSFRLQRRSLIWLAVLSVLILAVTPFVGILPRMSPELGLGEVPFRHLMYFAAVPWMVAGGVLGVLPATLLAGISGLLLGYLDTHNIFTPLLLMLIASTFSWFVRQRFRKAPFTWLRFPIIAALVSLFAVSPFVFLVLAVGAPGIAAEQVSLAIERFPVVMFSLGGMVLVGGVVSVIVQALAQASWGGKAALKPSPLETHFKYRFLTFTMPIFVILLGVVFITTWSIVRDHAQKLLLRQLTGTGGIAAESMSVFLDTGDRQLGALALSPQLSDGSAEETAQVLSQFVQNQAFFSEIALPDAEGDPIAWVPPGHQETWQPSFESIGMQTDLNKPWRLVGQGAGDENRTLIDFLMAVEVGQNDSRRFLWGQAVLEDNPYAHPFLKAVDALVQSGGYVQMVDSEGDLLYQAGEVGLSEPFARGNLSTAAFYQSTTTDGRPMAHFFQPLNGSTWGMMATLPGVAVSQMAWQTTYPILLTTAAVMILILVGVWIGVAPLAEEMDYIAGAIHSVTDGKFDSEALTTRPVKGQGDLSRALTAMVDGQKDRMDKQSKLLSVSSKVTGQLNLRDSLHTILTAALTFGASSARLVLTDSAASASPDDADHRLGMGQNATLLAKIDLAVLDLVRISGPLVLREREVAQRLPITSEMPGVTAVVIRPLKWKDLDLGVFWVAYDQGSSPSNEDIQYLGELAQIASMAVLNAKTHADSQSSLGLMESIFDLLPDAILISDPQGQVLFQNKGAAEVLGLKMGTLEGKSLSTLFRAEDFAQLSGEVNPRAGAKEVRFRDGKAFQLISSPIRVNPRQVGQVMIFKDLTRQRQEESIKTEFVTTVSHELRSPLTLILGYAKILRLTGNLNEQQDTYISNIIDSVEEMKNLVQKLLDIGRLEGGDPLNLQQFPVAEIVRRVVEGMEAQAKQKNIHIRVNLPDSPLSMEADQTFITQALKNLLENAVKFSKMEGEVVLSARQTDGQVVFAVQDKGIGIAPLDQRNLFKKFSRTNAQSGVDDEGSGLGLAIVKSIAERHGGRVWLESQLGKGSTFYLEVPQNQAQ